MTEVKNENNEVAQQIPVLEKTITEKVQQQGEQDNGRSIIRFSKDHWVEVDEYGCLSAIKFHAEYLTGAPEQLDERVLYLQNTPYCTNMLFDGSKIYLQNQIVISRDGGFGKESTREGFEGLPIETTPQVTIDDPTTVLKYYQSLNELIDEKLSKASEIKQALQS